MFSVRSAREKPRSRHRPSRTTSPSSTSICSTPSARRRPATSPATVLLPERGRPVSHKVKPVSDMRRGTLYVGKGAQGDSLALDRLTDARVAQDLDLERALFLVDGARVLVDAGVATDLGDARRQRSDDLDHPLDRDGVFDRVAAPRLTVEVHVLDPVPVAAQGHAQLLGEAHEVRPR